MAGFIGVCPRGTGPEKGEAPLRGKPQGKRSKNGHIPVAGARRSEKSHSGEPSAWFVSHTYIQLGPGDVIRRRHPAKIKSNPKGTGGELRSGVAVGACDVRPWQPPAVAEVAAAVVVAEVAVPAAAAEAAAAAVTAAKKVLLGSKVWQGPGNPAGRPAEAEAAGAARNPHGKKDQWGTTRHGGQW